VADWRRALKLFIDLTGIRGCTLYDHVCMFLYGEICSQVAGIASNSYKFPDGPSCVTARSSPSQARSWKTRKYRELLAVGKIHDRTEDRDKTNISVPEAASTES